MIAIAKIKKTFAGVFLLAAFGLTAPPKTTVYLVGDSTMANKETRAYPETGWGMPFRYFFDSTVVVDNRAKNGRSTKSFIAACSINQAKPCTSSG